MAPLIELQGVAFAYRSEQPVLRDVNLRLEQGERVALTGANGAGKSTLLRLMVGLLRPRQGRIQVLGRECHGEEDFTEARRHLGLVFQDPDDQLFCPTVAEDLAFGPLNLGRTRAEARELVDATLTRLQLGHLRDRLTYQLSAGEKRLVSLATVLTMQPEVLLLDEPGNGLDEPTRERLLEVLCELPQAMILVSHDPELRGRVASRALRLLDGRLLPIHPPHPRPRIRPETSP